MKEHSNYYISFFSCFAHFLETSSHLMGKPWLWYICRFCFLFLVILRNIHWFYLTGFALCRRPLTIAHRSKAFDSWHFGETDIVIVGAKPVIWQACCLTFACWGTLGRSRGTLEHKKGDLGVQAWVFIDFRSISGPCFENFLGTFDENSCLLFMLVSRSFF